MVIHEYEFFADSAANDVFARNMRTGQGWICGAGGGIYNVSGDGLTDEWLKKEIEDGGIYRMTRQDAFVKCPAFYSIPELTASSLYSDIPSTLVEAW